MFVSIVYQVLQAHLHVQVLVLKTKYKGYLFNFKTRVSFTNKVLNVPGTYKHCGNWKVS